MSTAAHLKRITLHLARTKQYPDGSVAHGYDFVAPLTETGYIDPEAWSAHRHECVVHRFWAGEAPMRGWLAHKAGGAKGATWRFDYDNNSDDDDEAGYRFADHAFTPGEYVSIRDAEGELHTFKVVSVAPL